jgi:hypothetical protein
MKKYEYTALLCKEKMDLQGDYYAFYQIEEPITIEESTIIKKQEYLSDDTFEVLNLLNMMGQDGWEYIFTNDSGDMFFRRETKEQDSV